MKSLVVDDDLTSRNLLVAFLSRFGECTTAIGGAEAVEAYRSAVNQDAAFDVICMDILMPGMDGPSATAHIRALENVRGIAREDGVKIIMTTSVVDLNLYESDSWDAYQLKPIRLGALLETIESLQLEPTRR